MSTVEAEFMPQALAMIPQQSYALEQTVSAALEAQVRAQVQARYTLAISKPRDLDQVRQRILKECRRPGFAEVAMYSKPVGRSKIEGLSIRFAEMAQRNMTNIAADSMVIYEDRTQRIVRVTVTDVEANVPLSVDVTVSKTVERSSHNDREVLGTRQNSSGRTTYIVACTDDELLVKQNALLSKAKRNLILALLPGDIADEAKQVAIETQRDRDKQDPDTQRRRVFDAFAEIGITPPEIKEYLGREAGPADLPELRGLYQALKQGEIRWRDLMDEKRDGEKGEETSKLQKALAAQEAKKPKPAPAAAPSAPPESEAARFCRLMTAAQDVTALDRIIEDARATLKGADLHSAEQYAVDRRAALGA
ncbi:MAG TPA: hypothetical protein PLO14_16025 [Accumulibacter sp.]|nr:hypothetical protein [Accumulibacter sp.]